MDHRLCYLGYPLVLEGYSDASQITHLEDHSSTSGCVFFLGRGAIPWAYKTQTCITNSKMESKFVVLAATDKYMEWLKDLVYEILLWSKLIAPISIRYDTAPNLAKIYS